MTLWAVLERFQTVLVGFFGFAGIIFTLWYNARVARQLRRDERDHERATLHAALTAELRINHESLNSNLAKLREDPAAEGGGAYIPTERMDDAYRVFTDKIGLLSENEVYRVMAAYLRLRTYYAQLFLVGLPLEASDSHVNVPAGNFEILAAMIQASINPVDEAIHALERARGADGS